MTKKQQAQATIRQTGTLWAKGKRGANVSIQVTAWPDGSFVATAEDEHITLVQFERALTKVYGHGIRVQNDGQGYLRADGKARS